MGNIMVICIYIYILSIHGDMNGKYIHGDIHSHIILMYGDIVSMVMDYYNIEYVGFHGGCCKMDGLFPGTSFLKNMMITGGSPILGKHHMRRSGCGKKQGGQGTLYPVPPKGSHQNSWSIDVHHLTNCIFCWL